MLVKSKVKYIQSLSHKKSRDAEGVFVAEGPKVVQELFTSPMVNVREVFALAHWAEQHGQSLPRDVQLTIVDETLLQRISFLSTPREVLAIFTKPLQKTSDLKGGITLLLDGIQDPGNMGTIIRSADWFGITEIICGNECADAFGPKVVQASMGSIGRVNIQNHELGLFMDENSEIPVVAASLGGRDLREYVRPEGPVFLLIGNESRGIQAELLARATETIMIPRLGSAESLNAAIAASILLSHMCLNPPISETV